MAFIGKIFKSAFGVIGGLLGIGKKKAAPVQPAIQRDSRILTRWNNGIARLTPDGALDTSFEVTDDPLDFITPSSQRLVLGQFGAVLPQAS